MLNNIPIRIISPIILLCFYMSSKRKPEVQNGEYREISLFQIPGWYFELSDFNRSGTNSGWLISGLLKLKENDKELLLKYLYHE